MTLSSSIPTQNHQYQEEPYFHHGVPGPPSDGRSLQFVTRYLCGAAYVDNAYAGRVIGELIEDEQRAVAPSYGFDLEPVLRHCFRARRLWLTQHGILTAVLIFGLIAVRAATLQVLGLLIPVAIAMAFRRHLRPKAARFAVSVLTVLYALFWAAGVVASASLVSMLGSEPTGYDPVTGQPTTSTGSSGQLIVEVVLVLAALSGTVLWAWYTRLRVLTTDLAPGVPHTAPPPPGGRIADRLTTVARAQRGNITLHGGTHPFLGAGQTRHQVSLVVELRPGKAGSGPAPRDFNPVNRSRSTGTSSSGSPLCAPPRCRNGNGCPA